MKLLNNKVIFLTGGSEGIGYECAKAYVKEGARLVIASIGDERLKEVMNEFGPGHLGVCCDVSKAAQVRNAMEKALDFFGRIDVIHNNAGIASPSKMLDETTE